MGKYIQDKKRFVVYKTTVSVGGNATQYWLRCGVNVDCYKVGEIVAESEEKACRKASWQLGYKGQTDFEKGKKLQRGYKRVYFSATEVKEA